MGATHTPGPLTLVEKALSGPIVQRPGEGGFVVLGVNNEVADARLIAAAPDMLAALREWIRVAEDGPSLGLGFALAIKKARAAIRLAETGERS